MNDKEKRLVDISTLTVLSNWLTLLPITELPKCKLDDNHKRKINKFDFFS